MDLPPLEGTAPILEGAGIGRQWATNEVFSDRDGPASSYKDAAGSATDSRTRRGPLPPGPARAERLASTRRRRRPVATSSAASSDRSPPVALRSRREGTARA